MEIKSRMTRQKERLSEEVKKINSFFTAEELLAKANQKDAKIGIATVYRFLGSLVKGRKIHSYLCNRKAIYSKEKKNHCHFICEKCKEITHVEVSSLEFIKSRINNSICRFQIDVYGFCDKCKEVNDQKEK